MGAVFSEIIETVIIDGVTYFLKKGIDAAGKTIIGWFKDMDNDGVADSSDPEFWVTQEEYDEAKYYEELQNVCDERWEYFSGAVYDDVPKFIATQFGAFAKNPVCLSITSMLLVAAGIVVVSRIIRAFKSLRV